MWTCIFWANSAVSSLSTFPSSTEDKTQLNGSPQRRWGHGIWNASCKLWRHAPHLLFNGGMPQASIDMVQLAGIPLWRGGKQRYAIYFNNTHTAHHNILQLVLSQTLAAHCLLIRKSVYSMSGIVRLFNLIIFIGVLRNVFKIQTLQLACTLWKEM